MTYYSNYWNWRFAFACLAVIFAVWTITYLSLKVKGTLGRGSAFLLGIWTLVPPIWFFSEYYAIDHRYIVPDPGMPNDLLGSAKAYADYASKIWAAVLAVIVFLYNAKK